MGKLREGVTTNMRNMDMIKTETWFICLFHGSSQFMVISVKKSVEN